MLEARTSHQNTSTFTHTLQRGPTFWWQHSRVVPLRTLASRHPFIISLLLQPQPPVMENFIRTQLQATELCIICHDFFSETHTPVVLHCRHILGKQCLINWLRRGRGNTQSCPHCREKLYQDTQSILWTRLCEANPEAIQNFLLPLWESIRQFPEPTFHSLLSVAIPPALEATVTNDANDRFLTLLSLLACLYGSYSAQAAEIGAEGLTVPFKRIIGLILSANVTVPKYMTKNRAFNVVIWKANSCMGLEDPGILWEYLNEASVLTNDRYMNFLWFYTILISQVIARCGTKADWPKRRHEKMNLVMRNCCADLAGHWDGRPSNEFKDRLVVVYEELRRCQIEIGKISLRGNEGEEHIVRGLWSMAGWKIRRDMVQWYGFIYERIFYAWLDES